MKETSAGIIIYRKTGEGIKFLLLYHGGRYWNFPKGKIEEGAERESAFRAAIREVREETGLSDRDLRFRERFKVYDAFVFTRNRKKIEKTVIYYLAEAGSREIRISKEHSGYGWFLYKEAVRMLMYQNLKNNLKKAYEVVQGQNIRNRPARPKGQGGNV